MVDHYYRLTDKDGRLKRITMHFILISTHLSKNFAGFIGLRTRGLEIPLNFKQNQYHCQFTTGKLVIHGFFSTSLSLAVVLVLVADAMSC